MTKREIPIWLLLAGFAVARLAAPAMFDAVGGWATLTGALAVLLALLRLLVWKMHEGNVEDRLYLAASLEMLIDLRRGIRYETAVGPWRIARKRWAEYQEEWGP